MLSTQTNEQDDGMFALQQKDIVKALETLKQEAYDIATGKKQGATMEDVFGEE